MYLWGSAEEPGRRPSGDQTIDGVPCISRRVACGDVQGPRQSGSGGNYARRRRRQACAPVLVALFDARTGEWITDADV